MNDFYLKNKEGLYLLAADSYKARRVNRRVAALLHQFEKLFYLPVEKKMGLMNIIEEIKIINQNINSSKNMTILPMQWVANRSSATLFTSKSYQECINNIQTMLPYLILTNQAVIKFKNWVQENPFQENNFGLSRTYNQIVHQNIKKYINIFDQSSYFMEKAEINIKADGYLLYVASPTPGFYSDSKEKLYSASPHEAKIFSSMKEVENFLKKNKFISSFDTYLIPMELSLGKPMPLKQSGATPQIIAQLTSQIEVKNIRQPLELENKKSSIKNKL